MPISRRDTSIRVEYHNHTVLPIWLLGGAERPELLQHMSPHVKASQAKP